MNTTHTPRIGIIGGSGLGNALLAETTGADIARVDVSTPFGPPSAPVLLGEWGGVPIAFLARHGIGHTLPPSAVPYRANIWALKSVGCQWVIASGAVGSLRDEIRPRDLVIVDQFIDRTSRRTNTFFDEPGGGAVHVEFADPVCPALAGILRDAAQTIFPKTDPAHPRVHPTGTYVCMEGPAFSTRAESLLHRQWGGDLIGMTALPEAKLAREAELSYALIALATDYDCWKPHAPGNKLTLLEEIIGHMHAATGHALTLIKAAVPLLWAKREEPFPAHRALELAIWTDNAKIPAATREKLELLWGKYF